MGSWCVTWFNLLMCFVQVDLGRLTFLTVVGTQGRYARNSGNEFARAYRLNYSRDGLLWKSWRNRLGNTVSDPEYSTAEVRQHCGSGLARGQEDSLSGGKNKRQSGAETCDGVIEQRGKNGRKRKEKKRKLCFFFTLSCFWSFTLQSEEMTFIHQLPVGLRGPWQLQQHH